MKTRVFNSSRTAVLLAICLLFSFSLALEAPLNNAMAQTTPAVIATIPASPCPYSLAVNEATNKVYVTNLCDSSRSTPLPTGAM